VSRRYHHRSTYGAGSRVPLDCEQRAQFKAKLKLQRRPGRLTIATAVVGRVLVDMLGNDGQLNLAMVTIAEVARVSVATVKRALVQLKACGFLDWTRRLVRDAASGWRTEQASNAYRLAVPSCEVHFAPAVRRKGFSLLRQPVPEVSAEERKAAQKGLAAIARLRMRALGLL
jgi:hypothetical protein